MSGLQFVEWIEAKFYSPLSYITIYVQEFKKLFDELHTLKINIESYVHAVSNY